MNVLSSFPFDRFVVVQAEETPYTAVVIVKMFYLERLKRITKIQSSKSNFIITKSKKNIMNCIQPELLNRC